MKLSVAGPSVALVAMNAAQVEVYCAPGTRAYCISNY